MTGKQIFYSLFYLILFLLAVWSGVRTGFTGTHTPPAPFLVEFVTLFLGICFFVRDVLKNNSFRFDNMPIHIVGLAANGAVMAYIFLLYNWS